MGIDAPDFLKPAAIGRRIGEKRQHVLLPFRRVVHAAKTLLAKVQFCFR